MSCTKRPTEHMKPKTVTRKPKVYNIEQPRENDQELTDCKSLKTTGKYNKGGGMAQW